MKFFDTFTGRKSPPSMTVEAEAAFKRDELLIDMAGMMGDERGKVADLIAQGANPKAQAAMLSETALHAAAFKGNSECVDVLIPVSDLGAKNIIDRTPLHAAVAGQCDWIVAKLMDHCDVDARDKTEQTPLHLAAKLGDPDCVRALMTKANLNAQDKDGMTPLHLAAGDDRIEAAELLMERCDLNKVDRQGRTPLAVAKKMGNVELAGRIEGRMISQQEKIMLAEAVGHQIEQGMGARPRARSL